MPFLHIFDITPAVAILAQMANTSWLVISPLRIAGIVCGVIFVLLAARQISHQSGTRLNNTLEILTGLGLVVVSVFPGLASVILGPFSLTGGQGFPRLVGLLVAALLLSVFYQFTIASRLADERRELTSLVRSLAVERYLSELGPRPAPDVMVVVPAYNEEEALSGVLFDIPSEVKGLRVEAVVVVDGATDETEAVARRSGVPVVHMINRGQTAALATGYEIARKRGAQVVATIDADGQMVPAELERVITPVADNEADLVSGSRVLGSHRADNLARAAGVHLFSLMITILIGQRITDSSIGLRAIRVSALGRLRFMEERFGAAELLVEAHRRGLRLKEVPVTILPRKAGVSRKPASLRYGFGFGWAMLRSWLR